MAGKDGKVEGFDPLSWFPFSQVSWASIQNQFRLFGLRTNLSNCFSILKKKKNKKTHKNSLHLVQINLRIKQHIALPWLCGKDI